jgi:enamine deaminase RidA (YjgF/YER057c/UK114 family)
MPRLSPVSGVRRRVSFAIVSSLVRLLSSTQLSDVADYAYATVVRPASGQLIFTAGACPLDDAGITVAAGDYAEQASQVMRNLRIALEKAGGSLHDAS